MFGKLAEWLTKNTFFIFQYITTDDTILNKPSINEKMRQHCKNKEEYNTMEQ